MPKIQNGEYLETWDGEPGAEGSRLISSVIHRPPPALPKSWPAFDFYRRFIPAERIAARALAVTDPVAFDFLHTLDNAVASGTAVVADDPDVVAGLAYLSATPSGGPVLAAGRSAAILA